MTTIPSWAVKGAKVVCVDDFEPTGWVEGSDPLVRGAVYTIERAFVSPLSGRPLFVLREAKRGAQHNRRVGYESGYRGDRFRPVAKRTAEQDIAKHFSHHLHQPVGETEREE